MEKSEQVTIDVATKADDEKLLAFFREFYPAIGWSQKVFRWQYYENPAGPIQHWIGRAQGKIVASFAAAPHTMRVFQKRKIGWRPQDLLIRPEYRGLGLYPALTQKLNSFLDNPDFPINFTFPNLNSHKGFIKSGWKTAFPFPLWVIPRISETTSTFVKAAVAPLNIFDKVTDNIWEIYAKRFDLMTDRSSEYLNWRYFSNPKSKYSAFKLSLGSDQLILILKCHDREDGSRWAHICDLFYTGESLELFENALRFATAFATEKQCNALSVWYASKRGTSQAFEQHGFEYQKDLDRWVSLYVHEDQVPEKIYGSEPKWHLTMGDSDVY